MTRAVTAIQRGMTVEIKARYVPSRQAFNPGTAMAWLERVDGTSAGISRGHNSWSTAAIAALALANRRGLYVANEAAVRNRIRVDTEQKAVR